MDTMLLVITVVSLAVAAVSATLAWQVTRADRQRRAARVAALASAAGVHSAASRPATGQDIETRADVAPVHADDVPHVSDRLFARAVAGSGGAQRQQWLMGSAALVAAACLTAGLTWYLGGRSAAPTHAAAAPLELVSLAHNRADGLLAVSGLVRNPQSGARVEKLEAEVRVFDATGILIATRAAQVDYLELAPGQESSFVVTLGEATTAARYRVSFRAAGTMLPHVDRRTNTPSQVHQTAEAR